MAIEVIRLGEGDVCVSQAEAYKALRLEGLKNDPMSFANTYREMYERPINDIIAELQANIVVGVLKEGSEFIGVGGIRREAAGKMNHKGIVYGNYVKPEMRGKGIGKMIMTDLELRARNTPPTDLLPTIEELQLRVTEGNEPAMKLYISMGYEQFAYSKRAIRHNGVYVGEYFMQKFFMGLVT